MLYTTKDMLKSPKARAELPKRKDPYWHQVVRGVSLGYNSQGGSWTVRKYLDGRYHRDLLGLSDDHEGGISFTDACKRCVKYTPVPRAHTLGHAWDNYYRWLTLHGKDLKTPASYYRAHISSQLKDLELTKVTLPVLEKWQSGVISRLTNDDMDVRRDTANRITTVLKAILNKAFHDGLIDTDLPWRRLQRFKGVGNARVRVLSQEEINKVLQIAHPAFRNLFLAGLFTGCRYSELGALEHHDFDGTGIYVRKPKSKKSRHIPLNEEGRKFFSKTRLPLTTMRGERWSPNGDKKYLRRVQRETGIIFGFHALRHTYATRLLNNGAHPSVVAKLLGVQLKMIEKHYGHLYDITLKSNVEDYLGKVVYE